VFAGLDAEWALVCAGSSAGSRVRGWIEESGAAEGLDLPEELGKLVAFLKSRRDAAVSDRWLRALLERAVGEGADAQLAARVVVQAMVPGMVRLTESLLTPRRDFDEVAQLVVGCMYVVARKFPLHRQSRVAANLMLETLHHATRELGTDEVREVRIDDLADALAGAVDDVYDRVVQRLLVDRGYTHQVVGTRVAFEAHGSEGELVALLAWGVDHGSLPLEQARAVAAVVREESGRVGAATPAARKRRSRAVSWLRPVAAEWARAA
jgi:hypothetical protein